MILATDMEKRGMLDHYLVVSELTRGVMLRILNGETEDQFSVDEQKIVRAIKEEGNTHLAKFPAGSSILGDKGILARGAGPICSHPRRSRSRV